MAGLDHVRQAWNSVHPRRSLLLSRRRKATFLAVWPRRSLEKWCNVGQYCLIVSNILNSRKIEPPTRVHSPQGLWVLFCNLFFLFESASSLSGEVAAFFSSALPSIRLCRVWPPHPHLLQLCPQLGGLAGKLRCIISQWSPRAAWSCGVLAYQVTRVSVSR